MEDTKKEYFEIYSNSVEIGVSRYDINFIFSKLGKNSTSHLGEVTMSPIHAKVLLHVLNENIKLYENHFGEINLKEPTEEELSGVVNDN